MDFSDPEWRDLADKFTVSLSRLQTAASGIVSVPVDGLDTILAADVLETADTHLDNSLRVDAYLSDRVSDEDAQRLLGRVAAADFEAADLLDSASEEPAVASDAFRVSSDSLDIHALRAELFGQEQVAGAASSPPPVQVVEEACNDVLSKAGECASTLAGDVAEAVTLGQVLDGVANLVGGTLANSIEELKDLVGAVKKKVLDLIAAGLAKIAKLLGSDPEKIKEQLQGMWDKAKTKVAEWTSDALGRSQALTDWREWLEQVPAPDDAALERALHAVARSEEDHTKQLTWAGKAIWVFGKVAKWAAGIDPAGPPVVVLAAAGLGGWVAWAAWDHLHDVAAAAA